MRTRRNPGFAEAEEVAVLGMDLSLSAPAVVRIPAGWDLGDWDAVVTWTHSYPSVDKGDIRGQLVRLTGVAADVLALVDVERTELEPLVVAIEDYGFSMHSSSVTKLAELGGVVRAGLYERGIVPMYVTANQGRKYLLGKEPAKDKKLAVQVALHEATVPLDPKIMRRWGLPGDVGGWTEDVCDAFCCANAARALLGLPFVCLAG